MGSGNEYPFNNSPSDDDTLLGIDDPDGVGWAVSRYRISALLASVRAQIEELTAALQENSIYPGEIVFETNGATFTPVIVLNGAGTVEWIFSDGTTSASPTPTVNFGSAATRLQRLKVTPWSALYRINVGYQRDDGGHDQDALGNTFEMVTAQPVTRIQNLHLVKDTIAYICGSRCPITSLNVRDFTALHTLEFFDCGATFASVDIYGTSNLRRACFEGSYVGFLDFSASPLMEDVRGSSCRLREIRWGTTGQHLWHMCVRENSGYLDGATWPSMDQFPVLQDMWISGNSIPGAMVANTTAGGTAWLYNNNFTSIDMTNTNYSSITAANNPNCTDIIIDGCPGLGALDASGHALTQACVDYLLTTLVANGLTGGTVNLSGGTSAAPSATGLAAYNTLVSRGWTATINQPEVPELLTAAIGEDGEIWTLTFSEAVNIGAGGSGGFSVTMVEAGGVTLNFVSGAGSNTLVYSGNVTIEGGDTPSSGLNYVQPGDGIENTAGFDLLSFNNHAVNNTSAVGPPALVSATIGEDGTTWTMLFTKAVQFGAGGNGGFAITMDTAGAIALLYDSGSGSNTLIYTGTPLVEGSDISTAGLSYTQPTDGIEDTDGIDMASFSGFAISNDSQVGQATIVVESFDSQGWNDLTAENITWDAGDTVVVFVGGWDGNPTGFAVNGSVGGAYTPIAGSLCDSVASTGWFYQHKANAGSENITFSDTGGGSNYSIRTYVISGLDSVNPVEFAVQVPNPGLTTPAFSTTRNNVIVLFGYHHEGAAQTYQTLNEGEIWDNNNFGGPVRPCAHYFLNSAVNNDTITLDFGANGYSCAMSVIGLAALSG